MKAGELHIRLSNSEALRADLLADFLIKLDQHFRETAGPEHRLVVLEVHTGSVTFILADLLPAAAVTGAVAAVTAAKAVADAANPLFKLYENLRTHFLKPPSSEQPLEPAARDLDLALGRMAEQAGVTIDIRIQAPNGRLAKTVISEAQAADHYAEARRQWERAEDENRARWLEGEYLRTENKRLRDEAARRDQADREALERRQARDARRARLLSYLALALLLCILVLATALWRLSANPSTAPVGKAASNPPPPERPIQASPPRTLALGDGETAEVMDLTVPDPTGGELKLQAILLFKDAVWAFNDGHTFEGVGDEALRRIHRTLDSEALVGLLDRYQQIWVLGLVSGAQNPVNWNGSSLAEQRAATMCRILAGRPSIQRRAVLGRVTVGAASLGKSLDKTDRGDDVEKLQRAVVIIGMLPGASTLDARTALRDILRDDKIVMLDGTGSLKTSNYALLQPGQVPIFLQADWGHSPVDCSATSN